VAEHNRTNVDEAFALIRGFARDHNRLLSYTARKIIDGTLQPEELTRTGRRAASAPASPVIALRAP